jgi:hypothetical protein
MSVYDYNYVVKRLKESVCHVTFTKVDGTERVMECTLLPQYLPEEFRNRAPMLTETVGNAVSVWDVQNGGWRSFRLDSIKSIS